MKINLLICTMLILQVGTFPVAAQTAQTERADTRVYLADGTLVEGTMVEKKVPNSS